MKRFVILCFLTLIFSHCKTLFHSDGKSKTVNKRINRLDDNEGDKGKISDTIVPAGPLYLTLYGKRESGVNPNIEGAWTLESMDGFTPKGDVMKKLDSLAFSKIKMIVANGDSINYNFSTDPKLTPSQGSKYHIPESPSISFYGSNETFSGFTGCNRYSGRYVMPDSSTISLSAAAASTRMVCIGDYDEQKFLDNLHKVSKFKGTDERLELLDGDKVILTFTRKKE